MPKNRTIQVRVSNTQYERIQDNAHAKGHKTVSDFVRMSVLGLDTAMERKIQSIFEAVVETKEEPQQSEDHALLEYFEM